MLRLSHQETTIRPSWKVILCQIGLTATLSFLLVGCGLFDVGDAQVGGGQITANGLQAFQSTFWAWTQESSCVACHIPGGARSSNPFAHQTDVQAAYEATLNQVNFDDPAASPIVRKVLLGHNCPGADCEGSATKMADLIAQWYEQGEKDNTGGGPISPINSIKTVEVTVPASVPDFRENDTYETLEFDVSGLGSGLAGATLRMDIQIWDNDSYRIANLTMSTGGNHVYIRNLQLQQNGVFDRIYADFTKVDQIVQSNSANQVLYSSPQIILKDQGEGSDKFSFAIEVLQRAASAGCQELTLFQNTVKPILQNNCLGCHGGGDVAATAAFDMNTADDSLLCGRAIQRSDLSRPGDSLFVRKPQGPGGIQMGNNVVAVNDAERAIFIDWLIAEGN